MGKFENSWRKILGESKVREIVVYILCCGDLWMTSFSDLSMSSPALGYCHPSTITSASSLGLEWLVAGMCTSNRVIYEFFWQFNFVD